MRRKRGIVGSATTGGGGSEAMLNVEEIGIIRRMHHKDNVPIKQIARRLGRAGNTVRRYIRTDEIIRKSRPRSHAGRFLEADSAEIIKLYYKFERRCPPLQRLIECQYKIAVPLRMLERFCKKSV